MTRRQQVLEIIRRSGGIIRLLPEFVQRFYPDMNRLSQNRFRKSKDQFLPERWIGSSVMATNPAGLPGGGLSRIAAAGETLFLRDAIKAAPHAMLGSELVSRHDAEFRVLVKILDPAEPIAFHLHASDSQVRRHPRRFAGYRFGKDEAYYFLDGPKGRCPYTHVGLYPGVTRRLFVQAVRRGLEHALELSPCWHQEYETGLFVPARVPHRPGTALTLEIQQPSDVYTMLDPTTARGDLELIDVALSRRAASAEHARLIPKLESRSAGGEIATIFPPQLCRKFAGKRLRVSAAIQYRQDSPFVMLVWKGRGQIDGRRVSAGGECFVTFDAACKGVEIRNDGDERLEAFTFFPLH